MNIEKAFLELFEVMSRLRAPGGCPWDREQTHESIISYLIEEAHETQEALASQDWEEFKSELGDILCQVIFHSLIAQEAERFDLEDVCNILKEKLIRRHPHVFGETEVAGSDEVLKNWERIKLKEKKDKARTERAASVLSGIPSALPALMRSYRLGQKASRVGFEFPSLDDAFDKVSEELAELGEELKQNHSLGDNKEELTQEFGDLLFSLVNVARHLKINPENALLTTTRKFQKRFEFIEEELHKQGKSFDEVSLEEMDALWEKAKK
jgi:MazG family protein